MVAGGAKLAVPACSCFLRFQILPRVQVVPDAFEQELLTDIAEAESFGEGDLAAEWRLELNSYRAAKQQALREEAPWDGSSGSSRRAALDERRSD